MALFRVSVKYSQTVNGVRLEKGMSVEVVYGNSSATDPIGSINGQEAIARAFMMKYGIDMRKANALNRSKIESVKIG